ncbi:MAG TPA: CAP domain-containing protein, partial [Acidimicrobiales bacterium]
MSGRQLGGERSPSFLRLLMVLALACLAPVAALRLVGSPAEDDDNVTAAGGRESTTVAEAQLRPSTTAPTTTTTTRPTTTTEPADEAPADATTTTTAPPTTAPPPTAAPAPPPSGGRAPTAAEVVVDLVNAERASRCGPVAVDDRLATAAQRHSDDMAAHDYFSHTSLNGDTL